MPCDVPRGICLTFSPEIFLNISFIAWLSLSAFSIHLLVCLDLQYLQYTSVSHYFYIFLSTGIFVLMAHFVSMFVLPPLSRSVLVCLYVFVVCLCIHVSLYPSLAMYPPYISFDSLFILVCLSIRVCISILSIYLRLSPHLSLYHVLISLSILVCLSIRICLTILVCLSALSAYLSLSSFPSVSLSTCVCLCVPVGKCRK